MIVDPWVIAVLIELALVSAGAALWFRRRLARALEGGHVEPAIAAHEGVEVAAPPEAASPSSRSFWASSGQAEAELGLADAPAKGDASGSDHASDDVAADADDAGDDATAADDDATADADAAADDDASAPPAPPERAAIYLTPHDLEAAMATIQGGFGPDDLLMLQDVVGSTHSKLQREAKGARALATRLREESERLAAAVGPLQELIETDADAPEALRNAGPALTSARSALADITPELEDLEGTLAAMANGLATFNGQEWVPRVATAEAVNARIKARFEAGDAA